MGDRLLELVYAHPELADLDPAARKDAIESLLREVLGEEAAAAEAARLVRSIDGFGPLTDLLEDDQVTDILVNGDDDVWVERSGRLERTAVSIPPDELDALVHRLIGIGGSRLDPLHPITSVALPNGARLHAIAAPIAARGPVIAIRRFPHRAMTLDDLVESGTIAPAQRSLLTDLVVARASIVVSGATGVGKTTLLSALLSAVRHSERIVIIEETRELRPQHPHVLYLTARHDNVEGAGAVTSSRLVRAALRLRPDRIVIGEVRGPEAADALWALSTGHAGSMLTVHARGPREAPLVLGGLAAGSSPGTAPRLAQRFSDAIDAFVHLERIDGRRVVTAIRIA